MWRRVSRIRRNVSEEIIASIIKEERISELGTTLTMTSNGSTPWWNTDIMSNCAWILELYDSRTQALAEPILEIKLSQLVYSSTCHNYIAKCRVTVYLLYMTTFITVSPCLWKTVGHLYFVVDRRMSDDEIKCYVKEWIYYTKRCNLLNSVVFSDIIIESSLELTFQR
jgi:hypothetical protein